MHLVNYEEAKTPLEKALAAIEVSRHKNAKSAAWSWADTAIEHAVEAGIEGAKDLVDNGRYPNLDQLQKALIEIVRSNSEK